MRTGQIVEIFERSGEAIRELLRARAYTDTDPWQFAVEIGQLNLLGLSHSDLRLLVETGYLLHAREVTTEDSPRREFKWIGSLSFSGATSFMLTDEGECACQEICGVLDDATGEKLPRWDIEKRELRVGPALVKRYRCPALNQEVILSVFQEDGWPSRIDDPLPRVEEQEPKRRLHDAIKSLNKNQINQLVRFRGDGTGQGVTWELCKLDTRNGVPYASPGRPQAACSDDNTSGHNNATQEGHAARKEERGNV